jgi:hypothetical protein
MTGDGSLSCAGEDTEMAYDRELSPVLSKGRSVKDCGLKKPINRCSQRGSGFEKFIEDNGSARIKTTIPAKKSRSKGMRLKCPGIQTRPGETAILL